MPKKTFDNLNAEKKDALINAFLYEFTIHTYDDASLSSVVKQLGIAKGSIYQYFNDKLDLFMFLINECIRRKSEYSYAIKRESFDSFWHFFESIALENLKFANENPLHSLFLFCLEDNLNSKSTRHLLDSYKTAVLDGYQKMLEKEIADGNFREDISLNTLTFYFYSATLSINKQFSTFYKIDFKEYAKQNKPVFEGRIKEFKSILREHLVLLKAALEKK